MNLETVTISDLLENYYMRDRAAVLSNGKVIGFIHEETNPCYFLLRAERIKNERR